MSELDKDLREALTRRTPAPDFVERVTAKARRVDRRVMRDWRRHWVMVAAAILIVIGASLSYRKLRQSEGERAKVEVLVALRLTGSKLRNVQDRLTVIQDRTVESPVNR